MTRSNFCVVFFSLLFRTPHEIRYSKPFTSHLQSFLFDCTRTHNNFIPDYKQHSMVRSISCCCCFCYCCFPFFFFFSSLLFSLVSLSRSSLNLIFRFFFVLLLLFFLRFILLYYDNNKIAYIFFSL